MREQPAIADLKTPVAELDRREQEAVIGEIIDLLARALLLAVQEDRSSDGSFPSGNEPCDHTKRRAPNG